MSDTPDGHEIQTISLGNNRGKTGQRTIRVKFEQLPDSRLYPNRGGKTLHWKQRSDVRRLARQQAYYLGYGFNVDPPIERFRVTILFTQKDRRRKDPDGMIAACKPWLDGLVDAGVIADDSWKEIVNFSAGMKMGNGEDSTTIVIKELERQCLTE